MKTAYPALFYPCLPEEGEGFTVTVPDFPGCVSEGDTLADAIHWITEGAHGWMLCMMEKGYPIPAPSSAEAIVPDEDIGIGSFISWIVLDVEAYAEKHGYPIPAHA